MFILYTRHSYYKFNIPGTSVDSTGEGLDFLLGEPTAAAIAPLLVLWLLFLLLLLLLLCRTPASPPVDTASSGSWDVHPESSASSVMSLQSPYSYKFPERKEIISKYNSVTRSDMSKFSLDEMRVTANKRILILQQQPI